MKKIKLNRMSFGYGSFIVFLIPLFLINGPIWMLFLFVDWCIFVALLSILLNRRLKKGEGVFLKLITIMSAMLIGFPLIVFPVSYVKGETNRPEFNSIVDKLTKGINTTEGKTRAILAWFNHDGGNIYNIYGSTSIGYFYWGSNKMPGLFITTRLSPPLFTLTTRCGACSEHSLLFREMAQQAGIEVRRAVCAEIDHSWDEVKVNGTWITVDPSNVDFDRNRSGYNLSARGFESVHTLSKNISYVYAEYPDGHREDITSRYTNLTTISITAVDELGKPVPGATVSIFSYNKNKGGDDTEYSNRTDSDGKATVMVGGGDIKLVIQSKQMIPLYCETRGNFAEGAVYPTSIILRSNLAQSNLFSLINRFLYSIEVFLFCLVLILRRKLKLQ